MHLIHIRLRHFLIVSANDPSRHSDYRTVRRHFFQHDSPGSDLGIFPNRKRAENLGSGADHHIVFQSRMTLSLFFSGSAQCHALIQSNIVSQNCGFSDDHTASVIDKKPLADRRSRMDLNACFPGCALRNKPRPEIMPFEIKLMRPSVA